MYDAIKQDAIETYSGLLNGSTVGFALILEKITRLRQTAIHPASVLDKKDMISHVAEHGFLVTNKFTEVKKILETIPAGEKVVIFSQFNKVLSLLHLYLDEPHLILTGETHNASGIVSTFFSGDERVLLCNINSGGLGIDLTAANHVIFMEPHWNGQLHNQALSRVHRVPQDKEVFVHFIISLDTLEVWLQSLHHIKADDAAFVLHGKKPTMSRDKVRELFHTLMG